MTTTYTFLEAGFRWRKFRNRLKYQKITSSRVSSILQKLHFCQVIIKMRVQNYLVRSVVRSLVRVFVRILLWILVRVLVRILIRVLIRISVRILVRVLVRIFSFWSVVRIFCIKRLTLSRYNSFRILYVVDRICSISFEHILMSNKIKSFKYFSQETIFPF